MTGQTIVFEPSDVNELMRGWVLHAHKGRDRHDEAARRLSRQRYLLGVPAAILSAVVGTSVLASPELALGAIGTIVVGVLGIAASALSSLQTVYNYSERAEGHRLIGVRYKGIIRELEQAFATGGPANVSSANQSWINDVKARLDTLEEEAPVVPDGVYKDIQKKYTLPQFKREVPRLPDAE